MVAAEVDGKVPQVDDGSFAWSQEDFELIGDVTVELGRSLDGVLATAGYDLNRLNTPSHDQT